MSVLLVGCGKSGSTTTGAVATTTPAAKAVAVHSSLDGLKVLPHRLAWTATTTARADQVTKVEFLVDGKLAWAEEQPPYTFDDDGGSLVTSWIKPGTRTFDVRVMTTDGKVATDSVTARVPTAPPPPTALAGAWTRKVTDTSGAPADGSAGNPTGTFTPKGTYHLVIDRAAAQTRFPGAFTPASSDTGAGWILDVDAVYGRRTLVARGGVTKQPADDSRAEGGWWCTNKGPVATYTWSVSGNQLTLKPKTGKDACGVRGFIWAGTWNRARP